MALELQVDKKLPGNPEFNLTTLQGASKFQFYEKQHSNSQLQKRKFRN